MADSSDVIAQVVACNRKLAKIAVAQFTTLPSGDKRAPLEKASSRAVAEGRKLRTELRLPFWDAAMLNSLKSLEPSKGLYTAALVHNSPISPIISLHRKNISSSKLTSLCSGIPSNRIVAVLSAARMQDGGVRHIPMIDFHCSVSNEARRAISTLLGMLNQRGFLLASGKSYHFIGRRLMTGQQLQSFLGKVLLFSPIVDRTWIAHQLIQGYCALRISSRESYGGPPKLVAEI